MGNGSVSMLLALQSDSKRLARCVRRAFRAGGATLDNPTWAVLDLIEPAVWKINKSDALDARSEFCLIDDHRPRRIASGFAFTAAEIG